ncbi:hypothetical protein F5X68DRAFT_152865 [Plectosphaerella plurivora]|uniref:RING-type domain-containing protein n=1 Tax=Plectosphaerella plurivora TaxID=936078 RepID=A0A9P8VCY5_9PEZI|nr:hypothetical protein F5X68DRAFT_152865 [Plectosphaerella plurivora]
MEPSKATLDLEKELTCSICAELFFQPLTLLDCLHTYCGACLKDWFSFQEIQAENNPNPPPNGIVTFTCPSCRAPVRDTAHNATVATLLDMFVTANPDKDRTQAEKDESLKSYKRGDQIIPRQHVVGPTPEAMRLEQEDRRLIEEVRGLSLRDAGVESSHAPRQRRRRDSTERTRRSRDPSRESAHSHRQDDSRRRQREESRQNSDHLHPDSRTGDRRQRRSDSRRREEAVNEMRRRQVEHQSSLRSLISSGDINERDIDREIEEFARQIQEEGLLDGLDLDNIDLSNNDELSRKITEAYRRRQKDKERSRGDSRRNAAPLARQSSEPTPEVAAPTPPPSAPSTSSTSVALETRRPGIQQRPHSRSTSATGVNDDRSRPPPVMAAAHLDVRERRRRRNSSGGRSATTPASSTTHAESRPTARSQTDLSIRTQSIEPPTGPRATLSENRSSSTPSVPLLSHSPTTSARESFANRVTDSPVLVSSSFGSPPPSAIHRTHRPTDLAVVNQAISLPPPQHSPGLQPRPRPQLYPEPYISCSACQRPHIEYELHYNCGICSGGNWNLCIDCYRSGKGCQNWFGFGQDAFKKWDAIRQAGQKDRPRPHLFTANRFMPPKMTPGGAEGRRTLTTDDPMKRLQSGNFCCRCLAWANECYWYCGSCNSGDWGFCNDCVNQGNSCTHPLLPLTHQPQNTHTPPPSPRAHQPPHCASVLNGPNVPVIGPFKPLTFRTRCSVCRDQILPTDDRLHCFSCTSSIELDSKPGEYEVCTGCYESLIDRGQISAENGSAGWRRCPQNGHRMVIVGFHESHGGQYRHVVADRVGGWKLKMEIFAQLQGLQKWSWCEGSTTLKRLVTRDVASTAPRTTPEGDGGNMLVSAESFPRNGGNGFSATAKWAWNPTADDELLFPKGADVIEIEELDEEWSHGVYMGAQGLLPTKYLRRHEA